jgi:hypothetical protein
MFTLGFQVVLVVVVSLLLLSLVVVVVVASIGLFGVFRESAKYVWPFKAFCF